MNTDADESGYARFAQEQDPTDIEAATWLVRRREGLDAAGEARLQAWLQADPRHAQALHGMQATLDTLRQLPAGAGTAPDAAPATGPDATAHAHAPAQAPGLRHRRPGRRSLFARTAAFATVCMVASGGWLGWSHWQRQPLFEQSFASARGQQLAVDLPDAGAHGSSLRLDTATRLDARLYRDRREVQLHQGQALFAVAHDAGRPFRVQAGPLRITVVGTRFSVRHTASGVGAGQTVVAVEQGRVRIDRTDSQAGSERTTGAAPAFLELGTGQMVVADEAGHLLAVAPVPAAAVAPWREGRVNFDQTPLAQAIAEFERYGPTALVVRDPAVAAMRVGGSYGLQQWRHFAETLPQVLPVRLVQRGEHLEVVAR
jgi:transmembrane sensor